MNTKSSDVSLAPENLSPAPEDLFIKSVIESLGMGMGALVGGPRRRRGPKLLSALRPAPFGARFPRRASTLHRSPAPAFRESGKE